MATTVPQMTLGQLSSAKKNDFGGVSGITCPLTQFPIIIGLRSIPMKADQTSVVVLALLGTAWLFHAQDTTRKGKGSSLPVAPHVVWKFEAGG